MALTTEHERVVTSERALSDASDVSRFRRIFGVVAGICALFLLFTTTAMFLYPGGTGPITNTHGYQFFLNFFSDLGRTRTPSGAVNYPSMLLFSSAMIAVGAGAAAFFVTFARYFATHPAPPLARRFNRAATWFGLLSAVFFAGVGLTPSNLIMPAHLVASNGAFYLLLAAILLEIAAIRRTPGLPTALLWVNSAFVVVLLGYVALMTFGPTANTLLGDEINVTAQKIIVYTAIATISTQALLLRAHLGRVRLAFAKAR
jgi:hypothetical membrane protein